MGEELTIKEGKILIKLARKSIEYFIHTHERLKEKIENNKLKTKKGVFVTLHKYPSMELRGCIGIVKPVIPLNEAIVEAAISSAFYDPRFYPVEFNELKNIIIEISVLTEPQQILKDEPEDILKEINIGKDGVIIKKGLNEGLLLPQVAIEFDFTKEEFLDCCCQKAGLKKGCWKDKEVKISKFQAQIFREKTPDGEIEEVIL
ncbi:MAG: TIGR00296 family protein [Candidatus Diapherotrites archaeon]|nr:TIGR00296 family protein [Candidatus Diapherotrites archaeon]